MKEARDDVILVQAVEVFLDPALIHRLDGPHRHRFAIDVDDLLQVDRVNAVHGFVQGAIGAEQAHLSGFVEKLVAEIRMGDADHGHRPLLQAFAEKVHRTEFRDHVLGVGPGDDHRRVHQQRYNAALFSLGGGGRQHQNRLAAGRLKGPADIITNTRDTGKMVVGHGIGGHLAGQVHGHDHTHGGHIVVAGDHRWIGHIVAGVKLNRRVVVQEFVEIG